MVLENRVQSVPKGFRLHLGIFGRRNVGKSSLLNLMTRQDSAIVSDTAGTTTDPVEKPMELPPIGPVLFIDTAGIDDTGDLGALRIARTRRVFDRTEIALIVTDEQGWGEFEWKLAGELKSRGIPCLAVFNKRDLAAPGGETLQTLEKEGLAYVTLTALPGNPQDGWNPHRGRDALLEALVRLVPEDFLSPPPIVSDLVPPGELVVLVVPIDKEAPKGRLILPQVQTIRDLLDGDRYCMVVKTHQLAAALDRLKTPPALVVTDSQDFAEVGRTVPAAIPLTSFSVLFARQKGDLPTMIAGARMIRKLGPQSRILIAESCTHHPIAEDIGTVKIPNLLRKTLGGDDGPVIGHVHGHDFPGESIVDWDLVIHCGACMTNRREMLSRLLHCHRHGVAITNYGLAIAALLGILDRAVEVFEGGK